MPTVEQIKPASIQVLEQAYRQAVIEYRATISEQRALEERHADVIRDVKAANEDVRLARRAADEIADAVRSLGWPEPVTESNDSEPVT